MSLALTPYLKKWPKKLLPFFFFELTDETFSLHYLNFSKNNNSIYKSILINIISHLSWITGTFLGIIFGNLITDISKFGLDFSLVGMFAVLIAWQINKPIHILVVLISSMFTLFFNFINLNNLSVILSSILAATIGLGISKWKTNNNHNYFYGLSNLSSQGSSWNYFLQNKFTSRFFKMVKTNSSFDTSSLIVKEILTFKNHNPTINLPYLLGCILAYFLAKKGVNYIVSLGLGMFLVFLLRIIGS